MAFPKKTWQDENVQFPNRYDKSGETASQVTLIRNVGTVTHQDPISASELNRIEQGIADAVRADGTVPMTNALTNNFGYASNDGALRIQNPGGASRASTTTSEVGYIKITLPQSWTSTMMSMVVKVFDYVTNGSFDIHIAGYNFLGGNWEQAHAFILGSPDVNKNFTVRFGHDGSKCAIYIGEATSDWSYPQITVTDFTAGFAGATVDNWNDGWSIDITPTLGTITRTVTQTQLGRYVDGVEVVKADGSVPFIGDVINNGDAKRFQSGPNASGRTASIGSKRDSAEGVPGAFNGYDAYFSYDMYYDLATDLWKASRTDLGRKFVMVMGYHDDAIRFYRYDGVLTSGWKTSDMTLLFKISNGALQYKGNTVWHAGNQLLQGTVAVTNTGWVASGNARYPWQKAITITGVTASDSVELTPNDDTSENVANDAGLSIRNVSTTNTVTIKAEAVPSGTITFAYVITKG